jgi:hypothetical protein
MRDYSNVVSDLTPGEFEAVKHEYRISPSTFAEKVKIVVPRLNDEDVDVLQTELAAEYGGE